MYNVWKQWNSMCLCYRFLILKLCFSLNIKLTQTETRLARSTQILFADVRHFISWSILLHINAAKHSHLLPCIVGHWKLPSITRVLLAPEQPGNHIGGLLCGFSEGLNWADGKIITEVRREKFNRIWIIIVQKPPLKNNSKMGTVCMTK